MKFEYPIKLDDNTVLREWGNNNQFGFYPIGRLNAWHGGIHLEGADLEIKAIADGEVIAYRLPNKYSDETILKKTHQYSNGFVLVKHYYKSPKGQELTFYSLYLHLMSKDEILAKNKRIPDIFAKKVNKITAKDKIEGLNAINMEDENDIPFVIPYGTMVQFDDMPSWLVPTHWSKYEKHKDKAYRRIKYTNSEGKTEFNILISTAGSRIAATPYIDKVRINTKEDKGSEVGALERRTKGTNSEILRIIPKGTEIEIEPQEGDKWAKVIYKEGTKPKGPEGYVMLSNVERTRVFDDEKNVYEKVKSCTIPVKAGELIGYTGAYGFEQNPNYRTAHVEVFTGDDVSGFLADSKNDGEKEKKYFKLLQGAVLKKAMPYKLVQDTSVKILAESGEYTQIEVGSLIREAYRKVGEEDHLKYQPSGKYYDIVEDHFETINCNFNNALSKGDKLYLVKELTGMNRLLRYDYPVKGEKYWVPTSAVQRNEPPPPIPALEAIPPAGYAGQPAARVEATEGRATPATMPAPETAPTQTPATNQAKLIADVEELYQEYPDDCEEDDRIPEDIILKAADFKKVKHNDGTYSYLIFCECLENKIGVTKKGWISDSDSKLKKISAYNWEEFGFKVIKDNQDELIYTPDAPPQFLKDVWKQIDADCNNVLTEQELRYALKNKKISEKLSHLVCLHTSEWSYKESKLSSLKSKLNTLFDEGIKEEKDGDRKQELKDKKKAVLEAMEKRVKELSWWSDVKPVAKKDQGLLPDSVNEVLPDWANNAGKAVLDYFENDESPAAEDEKTQGPTPFPLSNPKVYHFHPLAFVRQMRRVGEMNSLIFPFHKLPLNHPEGFKNDKYKNYDYTLTEKNVATFGYKRGSNRIHAARDLYYEIGEPIYAICDGIVKNVYAFYYDTWAIEIEHDYEYKQGHKLYVRYGEVSKHNIMVKKGDKISQGDKIAEIGLLIPNIRQPYPDKRGMLHIEFYTGEAIGNLTNTETKYSDMLYSESHKYSANRSFQRREDLFDPLPLLNDMIANSKKQALIK